MSTTISTTTDALRGHAVRTELFIGGEWVETPDSFEVIDPATEKVLASVANGSPQDALKALDAAIEAQPSWASVTPRERADLLRRAYDLLVERADAFIDVMVLESGKPRAEAKGEFDLSANFLLWHVEQITHLHGSFGLGSRGGYRIVTTHHPIGPSLLITPWNFPLLMGARKMGAALAAGCTVVVKSAKQTPLSLALLTQTLTDAGVPSGVVNLIHTTRSAEVSAVLMKDSRLKKVSFTGSTKTGSVLLRQAADNIMGASMELGGNGPFIVLDDADIDLAVREAIICKYRNTGQACVAANRIILHSKIAEEFTEKFVAAARRLVVGNGFDSDVQVGPMISAGQRDGIDVMIQSAIDDGARLLTGGEKRPGVGYFYEPTVLDNSAKTSKLACDELFAPVAVLYTVDSIKEAIDFANDTTYGLAAYLFTNDISRAIGIAERIESGMVGINRGVMADAAAPFGGTKSSGLGREGGEGAIHEFLETKYIALTISDEGSLS